MVKNNRIGIALSPRSTQFGPILFSGELEKGIKEVGKNNFDVVELSIRDISDIDPINVLTSLKKANLSVSALATGQACLFDKLCLGTNDNSIREKTIKHIMKICELAVLLGTSNVIIGGIRGRLDGEGEEFNRNYEKGIKTIRECASYAEKLRLNILIEPINRYETNWIYSASDGLLVIKEVGVKSIKLLLDTFHMNIEESDICMAIRHAADNLGYMHFADNTRSAPGMGQIRFSEILKELGEINYSGPIVSEILPLPDDLTALKLTRDFWENIIKTG